MHPLSNIFKYRFRTLVLTPLLILNASLLSVYLIFALPKDTWRYRRDLTIQHDDFSELSDLVGAEGLESKGWTLPIPGGLESYGKGREGCGYCGPEDLICREYGEHNLARSRAYEGPNTRLTRVLHKAREGQPLKVAVLGGAITWGQGVHHNDNWATLFFDKFNTTYPNSGNNAFVNGAAAAGTSAYYSSCYGEHIDDDVDLIIIELSTDDPRNDETAREYELLLRGLLSLPHRPAIINAHVIGLGRDTITAGGDLHLGIASYYDVPTVSLRNVLQQHIFLHPEQDEELFIKQSNNRPNWKHMNDRGHRMLADLLMSFINRQNCAMRTIAEDAMDWANTERRMPSFGDVANDIPPLSLFEKYERSSAPPTFRPTCMSAGSPRNALTPSSQHGWRLGWTDSKKYFRSNKPGSRISFELESVELGIVRVSYMRSKVHGLGNAKCWLDDKPEEGRVLKGYSDLPDLDVAVMETLTTSAAPGRHMVHCEVLHSTEDPSGRREVRIVAVASI